MPLEGLWEFLQDAFVQPWALEDQVVLRHIWTSMTQLKQMKCDLSHPQMDPRTPPLPIQLAGAAHSGQSSWSLPTHFWACPLLFQPQGNQAMAGRTGTHCRGWAPECGGLWTGSGQEVPRSPEDCWGPQLGTHSLLEMLIQPTSVQQDLRVPHEAPGPGVSVPGARASPPFSYC